MADTLTYTQAKAELQEVVQAIQSNTLDMDSLTAKVKRATELIAICKEKLTTIDTDLQTLLDDIENV